MARAGSLGVQGMGYGGGGWDPVEPVGLLGGDRPENSAARDF